MNKKKLILLALFLSLSTSACQYTQKESKEAFYKYRKGNIYIGNVEYLNSLNKEENDILILDKRDGDDPNIKIIDSYLITDVNLINEVLDVVLEYEKENPSEWNRTKKTMAIEWLLHNTAYYLNYQRDRTKDVDLNNLDEDYYEKNDYLSLILSKR